MGKGKGKGKGKDKKINPRRRGLKINQDGNAVLDPEFQILHTFTYDTSITDYAQFIKETRPIIAPKSLAQRSTVRVLDKDARRLLDEDWILMLGEEIGKSVSVTYLPFHSSYGGTRSLGGNSKRGRYGTRCSKAHLEIAITDLAKAKSNKTIARALLLIAQMFSESLRFHLFFDYCERFYYENINQVEYPTHELINFQNMGGYISTYLPPSNSDSKFRCPTESEEESSEEEESEAHILEYTRKQMVKNTAIINYIEEAHTTEPKGPKTSWKPKREPKGPKSSREPKGEDTSKGFKETAEPPSDSVSSLCFSPKGNFLVATSWHNQVQCWVVMKNGTAPSTVGKAQISRHHPVLCSAWKDDGTTFFPGGSDEQEKMGPQLSGGQPVNVATHDAPAKDLAWIPEMNLLVTGSWDKTLRYWDLRKSNPAHVQQLPERCYALAVRHPLMVFRTADRNLIAFNLQNHQVYGTYTYNIENLVHKVCARARLTGEISPSYMIVRPQPEKRDPSLLTMLKSFLAEMESLNVIMRREEVETPKLWVQICIQRMVELAKDSTTMRLVVPWQGLPMMALSDMSYYVEYQGNQQFILTAVVRDLDHKNVSDDPKIKSNIIQTAAGLDRQIRSKVVLSDIVCVNDLCRHMRKRLQASVESVGKKELNLNITPQSSIEDRLRGTAKGIADACPLFDMVATLENLPSSRIVARATIGPLMVLADRLASSHSKQGHPMLVELKNGETYNGHLVNCDTWMNMHLSEVICGNTIKYLQVPDEVIDKVQEEKSHSGADDHL